MEIEKIIEKININRDQLNHILAWMKTINNDINSLEKKIKRISNTVLNTRTNADLHLKIQEFGRLMDEMNLRILKLEKNGGSGEGD